MSCGFHQAYERLDKSGAPLAEANSWLDLEGFRPIAEELCKNKTGKSSHPNIDSVRILKILILQHSYSLSDQRMQRAFHL
jgi:hypothetical protein